MATRFQNDSFGRVKGHTCKKQATTLAGRGTSRKRWLRFLVLAASVSAVALPSTGCTMARGLSRGLTRHDFLDDFLIGYRNSAWSARAWLCRRERFRNHPYLSDFEAGFRQGYEDIARGGTGCVPAVCPRGYWGWQYQSADGQKRMNAWFEAYPLGVQAAEEDGIGHWGHVATGVVGGAPCATCPTGATYAVPPPGSPPPAPGAGVETLPLPEGLVPEPLPYPLYDGVQRPLATPPSETTESGQSYVLESSAGDA